MPFDFYPNNLEHDIEHTVFRYHKVNLKYMYIYYVQGYKHNWPDIFHNAFYRNSSILGSHKLYIGRFIWKE